MLRSVVLKSIGVWLTLILSVARTGLADDWQELLRPIPSASNAILAIDALRLWRPSR